MKRFFVCASLSLISLAELSMTSAIAQEVSPSTQTQSDPTSQMQMMNENMMKMKDEMQQMHKEMLKMHEKMMGGENGMCGSQMMPNSASKDKMSGAKNLKNKAPSSKTPTAGHQERHPTK